MVWGKRIPCSCLFISFWEAHVGAHAPHPGPWRVRLAVSGEQAQPPGPSEPSPALPGHVSIVRGPFGRPCPLAPPPRCCFAAECCQGVSGDVGSHRSVATLWPGHTWPCAGMWQPPWKGALAAVCTSQHSHWKKYFKTPCSFFAPCPGRVLTVFLPRGLPVPRPSALCPTWRGFAAGGQRVSPSWA